MSGICPSRGLRRPTIIAIRAEPAYNEPTLGNLNDDKEILNDVCPCVSQRVGGSLARTTDARRPSRLSTLGSARRSQSGRLPWPQVPAPRRRSSDPERL